MSVRHGSKYRTGRKSSIRSTVSYLEFLYRGVFLLLLVLFLPIVIQARHQQPTVDNFCTLTGIPSRDPAENERLFLRRKEQFCKMLIGQDSRDQIPVAKFQYNTCGGQTTYCTWRVTEAVVRITKENADKGQDPGTALGGFEYIHRIDDSPNKDAVTGMIIGMQLGGMSVPQNLFPQSPKMASEWLVFERQIKECLFTGDNVVATLQWRFSYRTPFSSRPYLIKYSAAFSGASTCSNLQKNFEN